jgi:hypothetical protein
VWETHIAIYIAADACVPVKISCRLPTCSSASTFSISGTVRVQYTSLPTWQQQQQCQCQHKIRLVMKGLWMFSCLQLSSSALQRSQRQTHFAADAAASCARPALNKLTVPNKNSAARSPSRSYLSPQILQLLQYI